MDLVFATGNAGKLREAAEILGPGFRVLSPADVGLAGFDVEETGTTFRENSLLKAQALWQSCGLPCFADDSGLEVDALGGAPGIYSARYASDHNFENAVFVGHSLGTPVCRRTLMSTDHGGALVDVDGVYCFYDGTETPEYVEAINQFSHAFDGPDCREVITGFVSSLAGPNTPQEVTDYAMSVMPETPQYVASSTMQHLVERQWWPSVKTFQETSLPIPVMVICTQNSGLEPDNEQKMRALYPKLDYTELTTCGHFIHMEQPEMFNKKLKRF